MKFTSIIYLDPALTSHAYEELQDVSPLTKIAQTTEVEGGLSGVLMRASGGFRETREFSVSTVKMFREIESHLSALPSIALSDAKNAKDLFWVVGNLCVGRQALRDHKGTTIQEVPYFMIADFAEKGRMAETYLGLAVHDGYFTSGYDRMAAFKETLAARIFEPVRVLLRPLFSNSNADNHLFAPFVILRHAPAQHS